MSAPRLTIIMPSHNTERYISQSIDSIVAQSFADWELIIVDGASTDSTRAIAGRYEQRERRVKLIVPRHDDGVASARNLALDQARGEYIAFIDSDDIWYPQKSALQIATIERTHADISFTAYWRVSDRTQRRTLVSVPPHVSYRTMLRRDLIGTSTAMIRRTTCGSFRMPILRVAEDHAYWLALLRDGKRTTIGMNEPLVEYRVRSDSLSANKIISARAAWKLRHEIEGFGTLKSLWLFSGYVFDAVRIRLSLRKRHSARE